MLFSTLFCYHDTYRVWLSPETTRLFWSEMKRYLMMSHMCVDELSYIFTDSVTCWLTLSCDVTHTNKLTVMRQTSDNQFQFFFFSLYPKAAACDERLTSPETCHTSQRMSLKYTKTCLVFLCCGCFKISSLFSGQTQGIGSLFRHLTRPRHAAAFTSFSQRSRGQRPCRGSGTGRLAFFSLLPPCWCVVCFVLTGMGLYKSERAVSSVIGLTISCSDAGLCCWSQFKTGSSYINTDTSWWIDCVHYGCVCTFSYGVPYFYMSNL